MIRTAAFVLSLGAALTPPSVLEAEHPEGRGPRRALLRGYDFPSGVVALTWDDGPDAHTVDLARFLHDAHVSGTFFVVEGWRPGLSAEPGHGETGRSGHGALPILGDLVALGHRVGAHTLHHVLLADAPTQIVNEELGGSLRAIAPFAHGLPMFRAPAGSWSADAALGIADRDDAVGPVHWDIDAKDWDGSLYCRSRTEDCEPGPIPGEARVRASVMAARYVAQVERRGRGIVLLHDRVGDVGSTYALDVARALVPALRARGFVFVAPVLEFGPLRAFAHAASESHFGDLNGDGFVDRCSAEEDGIRCALSDGRAFKEPSVWAPERQAFSLVDVDGDARADLCFDNGRCRLAP